jgi:hypothetical protein
MKWTQELAEVAAMGVALMAVGLLAFYAVPVVLQWLAQPSLLPAICP